MVNIIQIFSLNIIFLINIVDNVCLLKLSTLKDLSALILKSVLIYKLRIKKYYNYNMKVY